MLLDQLDEAADVIERARRWPDPSGRLDRLAADLLLRQGSPDALVDWTENHVTGLPPAPESKFRKLVTGRNIVIAGPNTDPDIRRRLRHRFDVVVDTKRLGGVDELEGAHISYYADTSLAMFDTEIKTLLDVGSSAIAVARPTFLSSEQSIEHDSIRIMPTEDSLASDGSHFGIARAVYDIISVAPCSITLVGVDMFTAATTYPPDYVSDRSVYASHQVAHGLPTFNHDLADDHTFLSGLFQNGLVRADDVTSTVLQMAVDEYLDRLSGRTLT